jgi:hypothetical protein
MIHLIIKILAKIDLFLSRSYVVIPGAKGVRNLTKEDIARAMERLKDNADFSILRARWMQLRSEIMERGKNEKDDKVRADLFIELRGFDRAVREVFAWGSFFNDEIKKQDRMREALQREHPTAHLEK